MLSINPKKARNNLNSTARARTEKPGPSPTLLREVNTFTNQQNFNANLRGERLMKSQ